MADPKAPPPLLRSPWLSHELFAATKRATSAPDGVAHAKRSALAKVAQELRRGRSHLDQQLRELEAQLLGVSDFLSGARTTLYTDRGLPETVELAAAAAAVVVGAGGAGSLAAGGGGGAVAAPIVGVLSAIAAAELGDAGVASPNSAGLRSKFVQHSFPGVGVGDTAPPSHAAGTAVEDDLAADTPCTTVGLWKYAAAFDIFKGVTQQDVESSLQLEEVDTVSETDDGAVLEGAVYELSNESKRRLAAQVLGARDGSATDDFLKARLVAALLPVPERRTEDASSSLPPPLVPGYETAENGEEEEMRAVKANAAAPEIDDWSARGIADALRDVGLVERSDSELRKRMRDPEDDEVSCELRELKCLLRDQVHQNNEAKRVLRNVLQTTEPWLSRAEEANKAIEKEYQSVWRQKQEAERKKKLKDKKLLRREGEFSFAGVQLP